MQYRDWRIMHDRQKLAASAFCGGNPMLSNFVREKNGYEMDGYHYPANSLSQADYTKTVMREDCKMTKNELANRRHPYLDPLPVYSWWDVAGGAVLLLGVVALAYVFLWVF